MPAAKESVEQLESSINKLKTSLGELQSGFSSLSKVIPTDLITKLSSSYLEASVRAGLTTSQFYKLKESVQSLRRETKNYSEIELVNLNKTLLTSNSTLGVLSLSSEKYAEILTKKFPTGAEQAARQLGMLAKIVPELTLSMTDGTKTQYDYSTALSLSIRAGEDAAQVYNQLTNEFNAQELAELRAIKTVKEFQSRISDLSVNLQRELLPILGTVNRVFSDQGKSTEDMTAKLLKYSIIAATAAAATKGLLSVTGLGKALAGAGLSGPMAIGAAGAIGIPIAYQLGTDVANKAGRSRRERAMTPAEAGAESRADELAKRGGIREVMAEQAIEKQSREFNKLYQAKLKEAELAKGVQKIELFREASLAKINQLKKEIAALDVEGLEKTQTQTRLIQQQKTQWEAIESLDKRVIDYRRAEIEISQSQVDRDHERGALLSSLLPNIDQQIKKERQIADTLMREADTMGDSVEAQQKRSEAARRFADADIREFQTRKQAYDEQREMLDAQKSIQESQLEILKATYAPITDMVGAQTRSLQISMKDLSLAKERLEVLRSMPNAQREVAQQEKLIASLQAQIAQQATYIRRTWMETMTATSMNLPSGTYGLPTNLAGAQELGTAYQTMRPYRKGEELPGTYEEIHRQVAKAAGIEMATGGGSDFRSLGEKQIKELSEGNEKTDHSNDLLNQILDALKQTKKFSDKAPTYDSAVAPVPDSRVPGY